MSSYDESEKREMKKTEGSSGESLEAISERLDRIEATLGAIVGLMEEGKALPGMAAAVVDVADEYASVAAESGIDVDARTRQVLRVSMKATDPVLLTRLERQLERPEELGAILDILESLPGSLAAVVDVVDDVARRAQEAGVDLVDMPRQMGETVVYVLKLVGSPEWKDLLESGLLGRESLDFLARVGRALEESGESEVREVGPFGLFNAMRGDDVGRTMGFAVRFARKFGRRIKGMKKQARLPR